MVSVKLRRNIFQYFKDFKSNLMFLAPKNLASLHDANHSWNNFDKNFNLKLD